MLRVVMVRVIEMNVALVMQLPAQFEDALEAAPGLTGGGAASSIPATALAGSAQSEVVAKQPVSQSVRIGRKKNSACLATYCLRWMSVGLEPRYMSIPVDVFLNDALYLTSRIIKTDYKIALGC